MSGGLGEAEPRVDHQPVRRHPGGQRRVDPVGQLGAHLVHHVGVHGKLGHPLGVAAPVHQDPRAPGRGHHAGHGGIGEPAGHVVDHHRAGLDGRGRDGRPGGVDAHRYAGLGQLADHRQDARGLGGRVDPSGTRPGGLPAHVDQVGPLLEHAHTVCDGRRPARVAAAVGEAVGGHVEQPEDDRVVGREQVGHGTTVPRGSDGTAGAQGITPAPEIPYWAACWIEGRNVPSASDRYSDREGS